MANSNGLASRKQPGGTQVDEAERKVGAVLEELEDHGDLEVKDIDLEEVWTPTRRTGRSSRWP
ncbi:MAG: hypothetical protein QM777_23450 [Pseudorhodoferax sp.]